ncbi:hypothetical protein D3C81_1637610 [compost metagenome]
MLTTGRSLTYQLQLNSMNGLVWLMTPHCAGVSLACANDMGAGCSSGDKPCGLMADSSWPGAMPWRPDSILFLLMPKLLTSVEIRSS